MKLGAFDYLNKPLTLDQILVLAEKGLESQRVLRELSHFRTKRKEAFFKEFVKGTSPAINRVYQIAEQLAQSDTTTVLIEGESGTGKELVANFIHECSTRRDKPFLEINCAAIPRELLESELFGHEKGAFTDARIRKQGLLELANEGTLFLDEVGEMSLNLQVKLLRVLERMTFRRVGGTKDISVSVRIISATNRDLQRCVTEGTFREDLYYRLKVVPIYVPSLKERKEDIPLLAMHFLRQFNQAFGKGFSGVTPEAEARLLAYHWPGNIRELRNLFERLVLLEDAEFVDVEHLTGAFDRRQEQGQELAAQLDEILSAPGFPDGGIQFESLMESIERALITKASESTRWNQSRTAELLNLKRDKLRYRMKTYGLGKQKVDVGGSWRGARIADRGAEKADKREHSTVGSKASDF
jgi:DNA-binding NtrC family response regulator